MKMVQCIHVYMKHLFIDSNYCTGNYRYIAISRYCNYNATSHTLYFWLILLSLSHFPGTEMFADLFTKVASSVSLKKYIYIYFKIRQLNKLQLYEIFNYLLFYIQHLCTVHKNLKRLNL